MFTFLKKLFCSHKRQEFVENIYGDRINLYNGRSMYRCKNCGKIIIKKYLHD